VALAQARGFAQREVIEALEGYPEAARFLPAELGQPPAPKKASGACPPSSRPACPARIWRTSRPATSRWGPSRRSNGPPSPGRPRTSAKRSRSVSASWITTPAYRGPRPSSKQPGSWPPSRGIGSIPGCPYGRRSRCTPSCCPRCPTGRHGRFSTLRHGHGPRARGRQARPRLGQYCYHRGRDRGRAQGPSRGAEGGRSPGQEVKAGMTADAPEPEPRFERFRLAYSSGTVVTGLLWRRRAPGRGPRNAPRWRS
jgi:hypothetical protein